MVRRERVCRTDTAGASASSHDIGVVRERRVTKLHELVARTHQVNAAIRNAPPGIKQAASTNNAR
jgi:hypothetical protein